LASTQLSNIVSHNFAAICITIESVLNCIINNHVHLDRTRGKVWSYKAMSVNDRCWHCHPQINIQQAKELSVGQGYKPALTPPILDLFRTGICADIFDHMINSTPKHIRLKRNILKTTCLKYIYNKHLWSWQSDSLKAKLIQY
jgi:hypothetical protein